jgi:hypothetical protein
MEAFLTKKSKKEKEAVQNPKPKENQPTGKIQSFFTSCQPKSHDSNGNVTEAFKKTDVNSTHNDRGIKKIVDRTDKASSVICLEEKNPPRTEKVPVHPLFLSQKSLPETQKSSVTVDLIGKEKQQSSKSSKSNDSSLAYKKESSASTTSVKSHKVQSTFLTAPDIMPYFVEIEVKEKLDPNTENIKISRKSSLGKKHGDENSSSKRSKLAEGCVAPACSDVILVGSEGRSTARPKEVISLVSTIAATRTLKAGTSTIEGSPDLTTSSSSDVDETISPITSSNAPRARGIPDKESKVSVCDDSRRSKRQAHLAETAAHSNRLREKYATESDVDDFIADSGEFERSFTILHVDSKWNRDLRVVKHSISKLDWV